MPLFSWITRTGSRKEDYSKAESATFVLFSNPSNEQMDPCRVWVTAFLKRPAWSDLDSADYLNPAQHVDSMQKTCATIWDD